MAAHGKRSDSARAFHAPESWAARLFALSVTLDRAQGEGATAWHLQVKPLAHREAAMWPRLSASSPAAFGCRRERVPSGEQRGADEIPPRAARSARDRRRRRARAECRTRCSNVARARNPRRDGRLRQTGSWMPDREIKAQFIEPMLLLRTENLPQGALWRYEPS